jgi:hypothetical protein
MYLQHFALAAIMDEWACFDLWQPAFDHDRGAC